MSSTRALFVPCPFNGVNGLADPQAFANMAVPYADLFFQMPVMNVSGGPYLSPTPNDALALLGEVLSRVTNPIWIWLSINPHQDITVPYDYTPLSGPPSNGDVQLASVLIADATTIWNWATNIQTTTGFPILAKIKGFCMPFDTSIAYGDNLNQIQKVFMSRNTLNNFVSWVRTTCSKPTAVDAPYPEDVLTLTAPPSWRSNNPGGTQTPSILGNNIDYIDLLIMRNPLFEVVFNPYTQGYSQVFKPSRMQQFLSLQNAYVPTYRTINMIVRQDLIGTNWVPGDNAGGVYTTNPLAIIANICMILDRAGFGEIAIMPTDQNFAPYLSYSALFDTQTNYIEPSGGGNIGDLSSINGICELAWLYQNLSSTPLNQATQVIDFDSSLSGWTSAQQFSGQY